MESIIPTIITLGPTGSGKTFLMKHLSGGNKNFKPMDGLYSQTSENTIVTCRLLGDAENSTVKLIDSIGFFDNRAVNVQVIEETSKLLQECKNGIAAILVVLPIGDTRFDIETFRQTLLMLGREKETFEKLVITFTEPRKLDTEVKEKAQGQFLKESIPILRQHGIILEESQLQIADSEEFIDLLKKRIINGSFYIPNATKEILKIKEENPGIEDQEALIRASKFNSDLGEYIEGTVKHGQNIINSLEDLHKANPQDEKIKANILRESVNFASLCSRLYIIYKNLKELNFGNAFFQLFNSLPGLAEYGNNLYKKFIK